MAIPNKKTLTTAKTPVARLKNDSPTKEPKSDKAKLAIILIRGTVDKRGEIVATLRLMNLKRKNNCVLFDDTPSIRGMIHKVKDLVAWGELNPEVLAIITPKLNITPKLKGAVIRLQPPRGGFERKGTKVSFNVGGALGYRGEKINDLIKRMV